MDRSTKHSNDYWKSNSVRWDGGAYPGDELVVSKAGLLDRLSSPIRGDSVSVRMRAALEALRPFLADKHIFDVGCGTGRFAIELVRAGAARVTAIDISEEAIGIARSRAQSAGMSDRIEYMHVDLLDESQSLPNADISVALGVLEYIAPADLDTFVKRLPTPHFLIHTSTQPPPFSLRQVLRGIYLALKSGPKVHEHPLENIAKACERCGKSSAVRVESDGWFVTNLPG